MNLNFIAITPFAQGIIKVDCEPGEEQGSVKTRPSMVVRARHHEAMEEESGHRTQPELAEHAIHAKLLERPANREAQAVVEIPVRMFFNKAGNSIAIHYKAYDLETGAPVCTGDGKSAARVTVAGDSTQSLSQVPCPGAERCSFAQAAGTACRRQVKMTVQIEGQDDPLSVFEVRSSSINSYRALAAQLRLIEHRFGGLRHVPLKLQMWRASNAASQYEAFDLLRLGIDANDEASAMAQAKTAREKALADGLNDQVDDLFTATDVTDPADLLGDDFQMVSDFYEVSRPARRTQPMRGDAVAPAQSAAGADQTTADSVIADAVRRAGAGRANIPELESSGT
ncbi:MAG: hypothetical protein K5880_10535 [Hydrogenophaga sp.]|uniref:recombination directionality factor n=1 Tax=Hydrogenophaga sp. TaxID=1904254 RepID=UPI00262DA238|nr:hypothetical protein [Hydrogenophaga sp.]MCV0439060.1 hypothetical protein [Hydrogenophaga sp.]